MTKMSWVCAWLLMCVGCWLPVTAAEWRCVFEETVEAKTPDTGPLELVLGPNYLWANKDKTRTLWDFDKRRVFTFDDEKKVYSDYSLYADVMFRASEFRNRQLLQSLVEGVGVKGLQIGGRLPDAESLFAIEVPTTQVSDLQKQFQCTVDGGVQSYKNGDTTYVTFKPSTQAVPKEFERSWNHVFMYVLRMAPEVRKQIVADGHVPAELMTLQRDPATTRRVNVVLKEAGANDKEIGTAPLAGYKFEPVKVLGELAGKPDPSVPKTKADVEAFAKDAMARGDNTDALLAWFEWGIMTGDQPVDAVRAMRDKINSDKNVQYLLAGFGDGSGADQLASLRHLDSLPLKKKYVLGVYEGNILAGDELQKPDEGAALLKKAIAANPGLVGAISDLGDAYMSMWDMTSGWALFDKAWAMNPKHPMLEKITMIKSHFEHDYPDLF